MIFCPDCGIKNDTISFVCPKCFYPFRINGINEKGINVASVNSTMDLRPPEKQGVTNAIKNRAR